MSEDVSAARSSGADTSPSPAARGRIIGLDLARFVAIIGMITTHTWLFLPGSLAERNPLAEIFEGRAAALFAVLAGVGVVLSTRGALASGRTGAARMTVLGRGTALILVGLTLGLLQPSIAIILVAYGVIFWVLALVLTWSRFALAATAVLVCLFVPVVAWALGTAVDAPRLDGMNPSWLSLGDPVALVRSLALTGMYPVALWIAFAIVGVLVGRALQSAPSPSGIRATALRVIVTGAIVWAVGLVASIVALYPAGGIAAVAAQHGYPFDTAERILLASGSGRPIGSVFALLSPGAHTGTTFDALLTGGCALVVLGALVLLGTLVTDRGRRLLLPVLGTGGAPLTVYVAHVVLVGATFLLATGFAAQTATLEQYTALIASDRAWIVSSVGFWALNVGVALAIGTTLALLRRRGPMETFVTWMGHVFARGAAPRRRTR